MSLQSERLAGTAPRPGSIGTSDASRPGIASGTASTTGKLPPLRGSTRLGASSTLRAGPTKPPLGGGARPSLGVTDDGAGAETEARPRLRPTSSFGDTVARKGDEAGARPGTPQAGDVEGEVYGDAEIEETEDAAGASLDLLKPIDALASLTMIASPVVVSQGRFALMPDGLGVDAAARYVAEPLVADETCPRAFHHLMLAAEATACHRSGYHVTAWDADHAQHALTGIHAGVPLPQRRITLQQLAYREVREWYHASRAPAPCPSEMPQESVAVDVATQGASMPSQGDNPAFAEIGARPYFFPASTNSTAPDLPTETQHLQHLARSIMPSMPVINTAGGAARFTVERAKGTGPKNFSAYVGSAPSTIGMASRLGARPASQLTSVRLQPWDVAPDPSDMRSKDEVDGDPTLLLRVVRPMPGNASDLSVLTREPSTLSVGVASVVFHDHPLFCHEDHLSANMRVLYDAYARHMRNDVVTGLDERLQALLSYSAAPMRESMDGGLRSVRFADRPSAAGTGVVYDFERDSVPDLCARAAAVLQTLSARYDAVTSVADLMRRMLGLWQSVQAVRRNSGITCTNVRLDWVEVTGRRDGETADAASREELAPFLTPHLAATQQLLLSIRDAASESDVSMIQLVEAGMALLRRINEAQQTYGPGYGLGGLGSGVVVPVPQPADANSAATMPPDLLPRYPLAREYVLRLQQDVPVTPDISCPVWERKRRDAIRACFIAAEIYVNESFVTRSTPTPLSFPEFSASVTCSVAARLYRQPSSIAVRILDVSSVFWRLLGPHMLASVFVPVPGGANSRGDAQLPTSAVMPVAGAFEFSASVPMSVPSLMKAVTLASAAALGASANARTPSASPAAATLSPSQPASAAGSAATPATWTAQATRLTHGVVTASALWTANEGTAAAAAAADAAAAVTRAPLVAVRSGTAGLLPPGERHVAGVRPAANAGGPAMLTALVAPGVGSQAVGVPRSTVASAFPASAPTTSMQLGALMRSSVGVNLRASQALTAPGAATAASPPRPPKLSRVAAGGATINVGAPGAAVDPNDPRAAGIMRLGGSGLDASQRRRFRVAALRDTLAFRQTMPLLASLGAAVPRGIANPRVDTTALLAALRYSMVLELLPPATAAALTLGVTPGMLPSSLMSTAGSQRVRLLRLRSERPELFLDIKQGVPIRDEDITLVTGLRELLRSVPIPAAGADSAAGYMVATAWALANLIQSATSSKQALESTQSLAAAKAGLLDGRDASVSASMQARMMTRIHEFLNKVHVDASRRGRRRRYQNLASIVKELSVPTLRGYDWSKLLLLFAPRRRLRPLAIDAGRAMGLGATTLSLASGVMPPAGASTLSVARYKIMVQIVRARNVPVRRPFATKAQQPYVVSGGSRSSAGGRPDSPGAVEVDAVGGDSDSVMALVEARFQNHVVRSAASPGPNPQWNQVLTLPFTPPAMDVTPAKLAAIPDAVSFSVFDEYTAEVRLDDRDRLTTLMQRQRRYLGSVTVPFFTIYSQGSVHAELRVHQPAVVLGYRTPGVVHLGPSTHLAPGGAARTAPAGMGPSPPAGMPPTPGAVPAGAAAMPSAGPPAPMTAPLESMAGAEANVVGLLPLADQNRRTPHMFVHITIDPPLPTIAVNSEEDGGGAGTGVVAGVRRAALQRTLQRASNLAEGRGVPLRRTLEHLVAWVDKHGGYRDEDGEFRRLRPLVQTIAGEVALITSFLTPVEPPPEPVAAAAAYEQACAAAGVASAAASAVDGASTPTTPAKTPARTASANMLATRALTSPLPSTDDMMRGSFAGAEPTPSATANLDIVSSLVPRMSTVDQLVRYVSLLPYLPDALAFASSDVAEDVWATVSESLEMGAGDTEEHAVMLHNFLLWLDRGSGAAAAATGMFAAPPPPTAGLGTGSPMDAGGQGWATYIVMGRELPDGDALYVLRQFTRVTPPINVFIDACGGRAYASTDDTCPLRSVSMVASSMNCWANIQPASQPWRMSFDFSDARCWAPLFTPTHPHPGVDALPSLQTPVLYRAPDVKLAWSLESEIHGTITGALRSWRPRYVTRIRGDLNQTLRAMLWELEARSAGFAGNTTVLSVEGAVPVGAGLAAARGVVRAGLTTPSAPVGPAGARDLAAEHQGIIERMAARYRVQGFPLHTTFVDMDSIVSMVRATGIHRVEDEGVQYGIAVAVIPYPNHVFSVWIYLVTLLPALATAASVQPSEKVRPPGASTPTRVTSPFGGPTRQAF